VCNQGKQNNIPIVTLITHVLQVAKDKCFAVGMDDSIAKPISKQVLTLALKSTFRTGNWKKVSVILIKLIFFEKKMVFRLKPFILSPYLFSIAELSFTKRRLY